MAGGLKNRDQLTPAEFQIIELLWSASGWLNVSDVQAGLTAFRPLAYTTVMTLLDKMARKESLERVKRGKAYFYRPAVSRQEVLDRVVEEFARDYFQGRLSQLREFLNGGAAPVSPAGEGTSGELQVELL